MHVKLRPIYSCVFVYTGGSLTCGWLWAWRIDIKKGTYCFSLFMLEQGKHNEWHQAKNKELDISFSTRNRWHRGARCCAVWQGSWSDYYHQQLQYKKSALYALLGQTSEYCCICGFYSDLGGGGRAPIVWSSIHSDSFILPTLEVVLQQYVSLLIYMGLVDASLWNPKGL